MQTLAIDSVAAELREDNWPDCLIKMGPKFATFILYVFVVKMTVVDSQSQTTVSL